MAKKINNNSRIEWLANEPVEWNDEPRIVWGPTTYAVQAAKPAVQPAGKQYVGNASKQFCIMERKGRLVHFIGCMAECQKKLQEKKDPRYCMTLYRA